MDRKSPLLPTLLVGMGILLLYVAAGKLGLALAVVHPSASAVWPPTGIAIGALLTAGYRYWPAVLLGAWIVNVTTASSTLPALGIALGNTAEGLLGAYLVNRYAGGRQAFETPHRVVRFTLLGALAAPVVSATVGVTSLAVSGMVQGSAAGPVWLTWWQGDAVGAILVTPLLVLWRTPQPRGSTYRRVELAGLFVATLGIGLVIFHGLHPLPVKNYPIEFLAAPLLVWAGVRFGPRETATATAALAAIAIWGTVQGKGPFGALAPSESLLLLQGFMGTLALTALMLAAAVQHQRRAEASSREAEERVRLVEERQRAEAALEEAQALAHLGSWEWDIPADRVSWSAELYRIYGLAPATFEPTYGGFLQRVHPADRDQVNQTISDALATHRPFDFRHRIARPDGVERILEARGQVVTDADGQPVRMIGTGHDVTELVQAEQERTELIHAQAARARAEATVQERDAFLSVVAHELKTPLTGLHLSTQLLQRHLTSGSEVDPATLARLVPRVQEQTERLARLIARLLDLSRLEGGQLRVEPEWTDVVAFLTELVERHRVLAGGRRVELSADHPVSTWLDPLRIEQVVVNLLENALKYSPPPGPVEVQVTTTPSATVEISIRDYGPGIAAEHRDQIFDRFFQIGEQGRGTGLGLGLYISQQIARLHDGELRLECPAEGGTRFVLSLPLRSSG